MKKLTASLNFESPDNSVLLEIALQDEPILFGSWSFHLRVGSKVLRPAGTWTEVCNHKEKGCIYRELDLPFEQDYRLQRCMLLNSKDNLLLLADAVIREREAKAAQRSPAGTLLYRSELYPSPHLRAKVSPEYTEIDFLPENKKRGVPFRVLPLGLPEGKTGTAKSPANTLSIEEGKLICQQETAGQALFVPLCFDWDAERLKKKYTWRQLTVGENLQKMRDDQAVGYRVQLHNEQFLLYRSLIPPGNRTVLGHNLTDDFCFARFTPEKGVEPLIAVEITE